MPFSKGSSQPRDGTHISYVSCIGRQVPYHQRHLGSLLSLDAVTYFQADLGLIPDFAFICYMTLGKLLNLSGLSFHIRKVGKIFFFIL